MVERKCSWARQTPLPSFNVDADIAHRHFSSGNLAENHEVVEIAEMADPENLARDLDRPAPSDRS